jgi:hypothetical protein
LLALVAEDAEEVDDGEEEVESFELGLGPSFDGVPSAEDESFREDDESGVAAEVELPLALAERESVMYQPLPLKTMPTGWMILRRLPPHCSHVVRGGSVKLWRFSTTSLQAVQV